MATIPNIWNHRKVADSASKSCEICYKPSSNVLITPDSRDFFYVCPVHLRDRAFCSPVVDGAAETERRRRETLGREIEVAKKEHEDKVKERKAKTKNDVTDGGKTVHQGEDDKNKNRPQIPVDKPKQVADSSTPRIFSLQRNFYRMRVERQCKLEMARRNRERLQNPSFFPPPPKGGVGGVG